MDTGETNDRVNSSQTETGRPPVSGKAKALIWVLAAAIVLGSLGWLAYRQLDEKFGCPSQEWAAALSQEVQGLLPADASVTDTFIADCDSRRAVTVSIDAPDRDATASAIRATALSAGWSPDDRGTCVEGEFQGQAASIAVRTGNEGGLVVTAMRGDCYRP